VHSVELADHLHLRRIEADLLRGLAQRGVDERLTLLDATTGEGNLPAVRTQPCGSPRQQHAGLAVLFPQRGEYG